MSTRIYAPHDIGSVTIDAPDEMIAGSLDTIGVIYTAGKFGIDDQGGIRLRMRFASDSGRPQFDRPSAPNYVSVVASNGATLSTTYDSIGGGRPWFKLLTIKVLKLFLKEGDTITVTLGDRSQGSAGLRIQTLAEPTFEIMVEANPFGTNDYAQVPGGKTISLVAGVPVLWKAVMPTLNRVGETFRLAIKAEDACGNPTSGTDQNVWLRASQTVQGLPDFVRIGAQDHPFVLEGLSVRDAGDLHIELLDDAEKLLGTSNVMRVVKASPFLHYWGDFHAQSEETIGTNSARDYFLFARDKAFVDFVGHQGNDFQITNAFWQKLNELTAEFNETGRFITIPGYEWSGVTALGGDRNVNFKHEGGALRRSSHALVDDISDLGTDCNHATELFDALIASTHECYVFAHIGGRYADLSVAHDGRIEKSVEIHSSWGTFEWLLDDAFDLKQRVGVVCNSDDHKGRPGASHPGASIFGAYGGLTCLLAPELSRDSVFDAVQKRRHYGTTGERMVLDVKAGFDGHAVRFHSDPALGMTDFDVVQEAQMGDIVRTGRHTRVNVMVSVAAASPILSVELRAGKRTLASMTPYSQAEADAGSRIRVVWQGAEVRGRGRTVEWDGELNLSGNEIRRIKPFNFWHLEKYAKLKTKTQVEWESVTTGNFAGFDLELEDAHAGALRIRTSQADLVANLSAIDSNGLKVQAGGLNKNLRAFRLPDRNTHRSFEFEYEVAVEPEGDTPVYVCVTLENGHQAWSSPIYLFH
jgi:hypothetical protein